MHPITTRRASKPPTQPELPVLRFDDDAAWEAWLQANHGSAPGIWMSFAKKGSEITTVSYAKALDTALCFGWIDGQLRKLDDRLYLQRFTPRAPRSRWSQINRDKAEALIAAGRMREPGLARIREAQGDGRWDAAYEPQARATVPEDLQRVLDECPAAARFFAGLTGAHRYAFLHRLHHVTKPEARAKRIADYVELLRAGRTLN